MKMDRKGIGGFFEAMVAMMVVCVAMTSFMGIIAYNQIDSTVHELDFSECIDEKVSLDNDCLIFDDSDILNMMDSHGLEKVTVMISVSTVDCTLRFSMKYGSDEVPDTSTVNSDDGSFTISSGDGRTYAATYEVAYWSD